MIPCSVLFSSSISCRAHDIHFTASKYYIHIMNNYTDYDLSEYESLPAEGKEKMVRQISLQTCTGTVNILILILNWWLK